MMDKDTETAVVDPPSSESSEADMSWLAWLPWALTAALATLSIILLSFGSGLRNENNELAQRLADTELALSELQSQETNLQRRIMRIETNYAARIGDLQKQVVQKNHEAERQKSAFESRVNDATQARKQINMLQNQLAQNSAELDRLNEQLSGVNSPDQDRLTQSRVGLLLPTPDGPAAASAAAYYDVRDQKGILVAENFPPLPTDREYQLWLLDPNLPGPVSAGPFRVGERGGARIEFKASVQMRSPERFAISVERKGGSTVPQGRFVLTSN